MLEDRPDKFRRCTCTQIESVKGKTDGLIKSERVRNNVEIKKKKKKKKKREKTIQRYFKKCATKL